MPRLDPSLPGALAALRVAAIDQSGTWTYAQARAAGVSPGAIRRLVDSGGWQRIHRGVFHAESTRPELATRMWAAHLALGPSSVVAGAATGHAWGLLDGSLPHDRPVRMLIPDSLKLRAPGVEVRRVRDPLSRTHPARQPPMLSVEQTVLDLAGLAGSDADAVEVMLRAHRLRLTTPERVQRVLEQEPRVRRRALIEQACADARLGVTSQLERRFRREVAIRHGLPVGTLQARASEGGRLYRDVLYERERVVVELDGRLGHETESDMLRDQFRDNRATLSGNATLRFGWLAVAGHTCLTAGQVAHLLRLHGWRGQPRLCGPSCALPDHLRKVA